MSGINLLDLSNHTLTLHPSWSNTLCGISLMPIFLLPSAVSFSDSIVLTLLQNLAISRALWTKSNPVEQQHEAPTHHFLSPSMGLNILYSLLFSIFSTTLITSRQTNMDGINSSR